MHRMWSLCDDLRYGCDSTNAETGNGISDTSGKHGRADEVNGPKAGFGMIPSQKDHLRMGTSSRHISFSAYRYLMVTIRCHTIDKQNFDPLLIP